VSRSNTLPEPVSERLSRRPRYQEILEFSLLERIDSGAKEETNKVPFDEKHALECRKGEPELVTKHQNDDSQPTILPLPGLTQKATKTCLSPLPLRAVIAKRLFEKEDDDILLTLNFKKPRGRRTKLLQHSADYQNIVETLESLRIGKFDPTFKSKPSDFQASS
jgi:hypothetical protein